MLLFLLLLLSRSNTLLHCSSGHVGVPLLYVCVWLLCNYLNVASSLIVGQAGGQAKRQIVCWVACC